MAARSEYQALKVYLSRYGEAQKQERRLADKLDRLDKDLGGHGAPDPQPGVSSPEMIQDFSGRENPGAGHGLAASRPNAGGDGRASEGFSSSDLEPGTGGALRNFGTGFQDPGHAPGKTGAGIGGPCSGPGYQGGRIETCGQGGAVSGAGRLQDQEREAFLNRHPLPPAGVASGNSWKARRRNQCAEELKKQRVLAAVALEDLVKVLSLLPSASDRRYVLELRYLDLLSWGMVAEVAHMSRSNCFNQASAGIRELLGYNEVQEMIRGQ